MAEQIKKLQPNRDLQCYFERPSAVAALSGATENQFTVSGSWRQQFDWAVVEWNRDNVFEHPSLRCLPDGDLSGLRLVYEDTRVNCIPLDSTLFPTVDWPYLRVWAGSPETLYKVRLKDHATAVDGEYSAATAQFELQGSATPGDYVELAWLDQHFNYQVAAGDTLASVASSLAAVVSSFAETTGVSAAADGSVITLNYAASAGLNANRIGVYGTCHGAATEVWSPTSTVFRGGTSPTRWRIDLDFSNLCDENGTAIPTSAVRKLRWTWAADLQPASFVRSEFAVSVASWTVTGSNILHHVAGRGSHRIEDDAEGLRYSSGWTQARGNYSGGSIAWTSATGKSVSCSYDAAGPHRLYLGTRRAPNAGAATVQVDGASCHIDLGLAGEDVLVRVLLGSLSGGSHTVSVTHDSVGTTFYFDFLEIAYPTTDLPDYPAVPSLTLATDWDTDHSIALAPERCGWLLKKMGFTGRANHYAGALWFYEMVRSGHQYATSSVTFSGAPEFGGTTEVSLGGTAIRHLNLIGDTPSTIATSFALLINGGSTGVWASASGSVLHIASRAMGAAGNGVVVSAVTGSTSFTATSSGAMAGGVDGQWRTDLVTVPRMNRAARDWSAAYFATLRAYGIDVAGAFSMELQHGDDSVAAGIAQRYANGVAVALNTPALQTNFGPESTAFWRQAYMDMATLMASSGVQPYLQLGEVQWWYFADGSSMPFYDAYTKAEFQAQHGRAMALIPSEHSDASMFVDECAFLPTLIGKFTDAVMTFVRLSYPNARFEVLYPPDVNDTGLNRLVNFPTANWTPAKLDCLKTENFTFTGDRDLDKARGSISLPAQLGFPPSKSSHLIGIGDYTTPWLKEQQLASGARLNSVVLFALDQFCLIGYGLPLARASRRARFMGR